MKNAEDIRIEEISVERFSRRLQLWKGAKRVDRTSWKMPACLCGGQAGREMEQRQSGVSSQSNAASLAADTVNDQEFGPGKRTRCPGLSGRGSISRLITTCQDAHAHKSAQRPGRKRLTDRDFQRGDEWSAASHALAGVGIRIIFPTGHDLSICKQARQE